MLLFYLLHFILRGTLNFLPVDHTPTPKHAMQPNATINGSTPFAHMWFSTISMYPTHDPLPSPPTRPCMSHPPPTYILPRSHLCKLLVPIRSFTNTLQSVQVLPLTVIVHLFCTVLYSPQILYEHLMSTHTYTQSTQQTSPPNLHPSTTGKAQNTRPALPPPPIKLH